MKPSRCKIAKSATEYHRVNEELNSRWAMFDTDRFRSRMAEAVFDN